MDLLNITQSSVAGGEHPVAQMTPVVLRIIGIPAPQGSKTAINRGGRTVLLEGKGPGRAAVKEWRRAVADAARIHLTIDGSSTLAEAVKVAVDFVFTRPPSVSVRKRPHHTVKPDLDKLARSTLDALVEGGLLTGDQLVVDLHATKAYAAQGNPPGAVIRIDAMEPAA